MKKIFALIIIAASVIGGYFVYQKISKDADSLVTVSFDIDGEKKVIQTTRGSKISPPEDPIKEGYTFTGWDYKGSFDVITKDIDVVAMFAINEYKITYETNCEETISDQIYKYGTTISEPTLPKNGNKEFVGWYYQGLKYDFTTMPAHDLELVAIWYASIVYNDVDDLHFDTLKKIPYEKISAPSVPEEKCKDGKVLVWYTDTLYQNVFAFYRMPEDGVNLYGRWETRLESDKAFLDDTIEGMLSNTVNSYEELVQYLEYLIFYRINGETLIHPTFEISNFKYTMNLAIADLKTDASIQILAQLSSGDIKVTLNFDNEATLKASTAGLYQQLVNAEEAKNTKRTDSFNDFAIDKLTDTYLVTTSEQLHYVVERGYKPTFASEDSTVKMIYSNAKAILKEIIDDEMNDYEKVHAIYDWLIMNITYDKRLKEYVVNNVENIREYRGFFLEGAIMDRRAVCDGISKAFVLLCRIEGIEAIRVTGMAVDNSFAHAWNKVRIDEMWYVVDATSGGTIVSEDEKEILTHTYLLVNDNFYGGKFVASTYKEMIAYGEYDIYREMFFEYDGRTYDYNITSQEELDVIIKWFTENYDESTTIDMRIAFDIGDSITDELSNSISAADITSIFPLKASPTSYLDNGVLVIMNYTK